MDTCNIDKMMKDMGGAAMGMGDSSDYDEDDIGSDTEENMDE